jgi:ABC-2 type transport system permease protein
MTQFWEFFTFELKFRAKSYSTYVYFLLWFAFEFLSVASESFGPIGYANGKVLLNGPFANTYNYIGASFFGVIVIAAIFGTAILRDFQRDTIQILFTKPISKIAYLGGRWAGSFIATVFAFSGMLFGGLIGSFAPWADHTRIGPNHLLWYIQPFFSVAVVQIFFFGSLFFLVAALSRKIFIVYLQGAAIFIIYIIGVSAFSTTGSLDHFWSGILDPIGFLYTNAIARYWTVAEKNTLLYSWTGVFLYNRILWSSIGLLALLAVWKFFPMSVESLTAKSSSKRANLQREQEETVKPRRSLVSVPLPRVSQIFGSATSLAQFLSLTRIRISNIVHEIPFWGILFLMAALALNSGHFAGRVGGEIVWPVTYLMLQSVEGGAVVFLYIVATLYAAELIWRERDTRFAGIHDALPMRETTDWLSKFAALCFVEIVMLTVAGLCGIIMQTIAGYYHYELLQYAKELYLVVLPQVLIFGLMAFFVQTVVSNKFIGHGIVILVFFMTITLSNFGWENTLYLVATTITPTYSDMNGYGHFVPGLIWSTAYWLGFMCVLAVLSIALTLRGAEEGWSARFRLARQRLPALLPALLLFVLITLGSGGWFYYNAHVLNQYVSSTQGRKIQAQYERDYKKYELLPMPKIIAVDANVDIFPERRSFSGSGHYLLQNKTAAPINQIHISDAHAAAFGTIDLTPSVKDISFDRPFHIVSKSPDGVYTIYQFDTPLAPGETTNMSFHIAHTSRGFKDGKERPEFAYSGTFFDAGYFPTIGYDNGVELDDPRRRREEHLGEQELLPHRGDPLGSVTNLFTTHSDWISFKTTVSTSDSDSEGKPQTAIAPGYLTADWHKDGRHYFTYDMGQIKTLDFFAYVSARYDVTTETYQGVAGPIAISVYHIPQHNFNVQDMIDASKAGLAYYEKNYSPFQFKQYRIMEYPRYRTFAQSFPNMVPFSEGIGYINRVKDPDEDIDEAYFVVCHELAHQWWGHQLIGAQVEGSNMMSESLAEYSALRVMEKKYGDQNMRKFLARELDGYLRGRAGEIRHENPLVLVQNEAYVWYQKGSVVLYALADYIGEDKLNAALHGFLLQYRYANATDALSGPYPDTRQFVAALRAATPPELQYYITDAFENIVLYDNKALSATYIQTPDKKYKVTLTVQAKKVQADGNGVESPMPIADYIDIGVFSGKKNHEKQLYLKKEKLTQEKQTFEIVVDELPTRAGIDPYNKLIDRVSDDNEMDITKP